MFRGRAPPTCRDGLSSRWCKITSRLLLNDGDIMSLLNTISRTVKGLLNDAAESVQDPSRDARQIVRELDESIGKAENALIEIEAQLAPQQSKLDAAAAKVQKYEDGAKRALQAGNESLAREALAAQANAEA